MMALDGYAARPPGTYSPTRPTGTWRVATIWPWGITSRVAAGIEALAVCRRLAASSWIASRTAGATSPRADSSSDCGTRAFSMSTPSSRRVRRRTASSPPSRTIPTTSATAPRT